jgi:mannose/fructose/N-acetylgalactosamine-specific phosphotransferase system component IIC
MAQPVPSRSGGVILAAAIIAGAVGGVIMGQPSAGFLIGAALGLVALGLVWLQDRRR